MDNRAKGTTGEAQAAEYLRQKGYVVLQQNWRSKLGELDIIASEKDTLVFVEVKSRKSSAFGTAAQAVNPRKQQKIIKTAMGYLKSRGIVDKDVRFDVVSITGEEVELIKNAFQSDGRYRY